MDNKVRFLVAVAFSVLVLHGCNSFRKSAIELHLDSPAVTGTLVAGKEIWYKINVVEECFLVVETFGDIEVNLEAFDSSRRNLIAGSYDRAEGNTRVEFHASAGNEYTLRVTGVNANVSGAYLIKAVSSMITSLIFDVTLEMNLSQGENHWYKTSSNQPSIITVQTTGNTDTFIEVYDTDFNHILSDDDGGENTNALVNINTLPDQQYYLRLRGYSEETSGQYTITAVAAPLYEMNLGADYNATLEQGVYYWYSLVSRQRNIVTVTTSGDIDTFLEVFDSQFNLISSDDDSGVGFNALIEFFSDPDQIYYLRLRGYNIETSGDYSIRAVITSPTELRINTPHRATLADGTRHLYSFRSNERAIVSVETTGNTDTYIYVFDSYFNLLGTDDDSGESFNCMIEFLVEPNQIYYLRLRGAGGSSGVGAYTIRASVVPFDGRNNTRSRAVNIDNGATVVAFFHTPGETLWYRHEITNDQTNLTIQTWGELDTLLFLYDNQGNLLFEDDDSGQELNAYISAELNQGMYFIEIRTYGEATGRTTFHAETHTE